MNHANRITVHHEGWTRVRFTDRATTAARVRQIQRIHVRDRGWGDIGYHYVVDRAGRVWEGRPLRYQGAHVKYNNEHNIGVLVLGNFENQSPSKAQVDRVAVLLRSLAREHRIPVSRIRTHREFPDAKTVCPGRKLQPLVARMRTNGHLA